MSQSDIMEVLDKYPGKFFNVKQIHTLINKKIGLCTVSRGVTKIILREEYECSMIRGDKGHLVSYYRKIIEEDE